MEQKGKTRVSVSILGEQYIIRSNATREYILDVASYVNCLMEKVAQENPCMSRHRQSVLTALNLAHEILQLKSKKESIITESNPALAESEGEKK